MQKYLSVVKNQPKEHWEISILFVLSETVATVSLSAPPTVAHIRHWAVNTVPAVGRTMQFGDKYLNDGHLPPEIPK